MKIEVSSLKNVIGTLSQNDNLISIRDRYCSEKTASQYMALDREIASNGVNTLLMYFDDIDPYRFLNGMEHWSIKEVFKDKSKTPVFFSKEHAETIVKWVMNLDAGSTVKVHCWAGLSRSQAVGFWLNVYFNLILERNLDDFYENNRRNVVQKTHFNCEVLRVFVDAFGFSPS